MVETWTPLLTIAEHGDAHDAVKADETSTLYVCPIKELPSLEIVPAAFIDSCAPKRDQERSRPRTVFFGSCLFFFLISMTLKR